MPEETLEIPVIPLISLDNLIKKGARDPFTHKQVPLPIQGIFIEAGLVERAADLIKEQLPSSGYLLVADENTYGIAGRQIAQNLSHRATVRVHILPDPVEASIEAARSLAYDLGFDETLIGVGSGTINDVCKYAAFAKNRPYGLFATAPSMNGYSSITSSLIDQGQKRSINTQTPTFIFCDLALAAKAPARMIAAGIGDTLCRSTTQADWLLSYYLTGSAFTEQPFEWAVGYEDQLLHHAKKIKEHTHEALTLLYQSLLIGGLNMTLCKSSAPASQGEHMIVHCYEMMQKPTAKKSKKKEPAWLHGEGVAVATLTMARLQGWMFDKYATLIPTYNKFDSAQATKTIKHLPDYAKAEAEKIIPTKFPVEQERLRDMNITLGQQWHIARTEILKNWLPPQELERIFTEAGLPTTPADIGWDSTIYLNTIRTAPYTRDRFTFLDLALLSGELEPFLAAEAKLLK